MNEWMNEWTNKRTNERMNERKNSLRQKGTWNMNLLWIKNNVLFLKPTTFHCYRPVYWFSFSFYVWQMGMCNTDSGVTVKEVDVALVFPYTDCERAVVIGHEMKQHATVSRLNYRCRPSADRGAVCQASSVSPLWGLRDPGQFILTSCSNKRITSWPDLCLRVFFFFSTENVRNSDIINNHSN